MKTNDRVAKVVLQKRWHYIVHTSTAANGCYVHIGTVLLFWDPGCQLQHCASILKLHYTTGQYSIGIKITVLVMSFTDARFAAGAWLIVTARRERKSPMARWDLNQQPCG